MDTPMTLKEKIITGDVWEIYPDPLLDGLNALSAAEGVTRASLAGDHLRVIVEHTVEEKKLRKMLKRSGVQVLSIQKGEPTLEDVFLSLAKA
jgi:hypothetical protein